MLKYCCSLVLSFLFFACTYLHGDCQQILDYIFENLPEYGTLVQDDEGFVYVDLPNDYIYKLFPLIGDKGYDLPPYFSRPKSHGAHISVIYANEAKENNILIREEGQMIYFYPKACQIEKPRHWKQIDEVYIIAVDAPALTKLRKRYGLQPLKFPFHITIGVKYSNIEQEEGLLKAG